MFDPAARRSMFRDWLAHQAKRVLYTLPAKQDWRPRFLRTVNAIKARDALRENGPLSPEAVAAMEVNERAAIDASAPRRLLIALNDKNVRDSADLTEQQRGAYFLEDYLRAKGGAPRVINIGARVDITSAYLAPLFPQAEFISVDFQRNLAEHNAGLPQAPNWQFMSGYALDLMRGGQLRGDIVYMCATATLFSPRELDAYVDAFQRAGVRGVFNTDVWYADYNSLLRPLKAPDRIGSAYVSGTYGVWHHDYPAAFKRGGYRTIRCDVLKTRRAGTGQLIFIGES